MEINNINDSLNSLLKDENKFKSLEIKEIDVNSIKYFFKDRDEDFKNDISFAELLESIKNNGLLQPIVVYQTLKGEYYKIAGGRRIEAFKTLGYKTIPASVIKEEDVQKNKVINLILEENEKRANLNKQEKTEFLLKALSLYFDIDSINDDEELVEQGKNIFKQIYKLNLNKKENLSDEETKMLLLWKEFSQKYNLTLSTFYNDIRLFSLKEPFKTFYTKYKIFKKTEVLKFNNLTKDKELFYALKLLFELIAQKLKKEGEISEKIKNSIRKFTQEVFKNSDLLKNKIINLNEQINNHLNLEIDNKNINALSLLILLNKNNLDILNDFDVVTDDINNYILKKINELFNTLNLENIEINLNENKKIEKELKKKFRKINKYLKQIDLENVELEILNKKIDELLKFLEKEGEKNEKHN